MNLLTRVNTIMDHYDLDLPSSMPEWFRAQMIQKLNRIADYCSEQCLIQSTRDFDACREWAQACLIVQDVTDLMLEGK
jgi:hypothetical protein